MNEPDASAARVRHTWPDDLEQLSDLRPRTGFAFLLDWTFPTDPVDACVPSNMQNAVSTVLARHGTVAFRWMGDAAWPSGHAEVIAPARRNYIQRTIERIMHRWPADLVLTRECSVVTCMFEFFWHMQGQAVLVLGDGQGLAEPLRSELATRRSWTDFAFVPPSLALLLPCVDGDGILFASDSRTVLDGLLTGLKQHLAGAGVGVTEIP